MVHSRAVRVDLLYDQIYSARQVVETGYAHLLVAFVTSPDR
jgi:hypothetical protein